MTEASLYWIIGIVFSLQGLWLGFLSVLAFKNAKIIIENQKPGRKRVEEMVQPMVDEVSEGLDRWKQGIELEWSNTLDKLNSIAGRVSKRSGILETELRKEEEKRSTFRPGDDREAQRKALRTQLRK